MSYEGKLSFKLKTQQFINGHLWQEVSDSLVPWINVPLCVLHFNTDCLALKWKYKKYFACML